jgi:hypothetical protein
VLLGDSDAAAAAQAAAADALAAAAVAVPDHRGGDRGLSLPPAMAAAAGGLVAGSGGGGSRGCPLYAKYYDKIYPHAGQATGARQAAVSV